MNRYLFVFISQLVYYKYYKYIFSDLFFSFHIFKPVYYLRLYLKSCLYFIIYRIKMQLCLQAKRYFKCIVFVFDELSIRIDKLIKSDEILIIC